MTPRRLLIVNADDFGLTTGVNAGIVEACERGILRAATLMANGAAFDDAVRRVNEHPRLDVGCHLVLVGGRSLAQPSRPLPSSLGGLMTRLAAGWRVEEIELEFDAQVRRLLDAGIQPSHLDAHKHTHLLPPVLGAMLRTAQRYGVGWIRRPFDAPLTAASRPASWRRRTLQRLLRPLDRHFQRRLQHSGRRSTDYFAGFQLTGRYRARELAALMRQLPPGLGEFMCHPGYCTEELRATSSRLTESREEELRALTSPEVLNAVAETGVELVDFRGTAADDGSQNP